MELPEIDWKEEIRKIPVGVELQERIKEKLRQYVGGMGRNAQDGESLAVLTGDGAKFHLAFQSRGQTSKPSK